MADWDPEKETFWLMLGFSGGAVHAHQLYDATVDDLVKVAVETRQVWRKKDGKRAEYAITSPKLLDD